MISVYEKITHSKHLGFIWSFEDIKITSDDRYLQFWLMCDSVNQLWGLVTGSVIM